MNSVFAWGLDVIRAIQTIESGPLTILMKAITFLGTESAFIVLLLLVLWCVDERKGLRLGTIVILSAWLNLALKDAFRQPRPYTMDPSVGRAVEKTYGFPSAHAQNSLAFWTVFGSWMRRPAGIAVAVSVPLAVSFTRLYLGVHFPTDILGGWIVGTAILAVYFVLGNVIEAVLSAANLRVRILAVAAIAFIMNAFAPEHVNLGGAFFGMGVGYVLMSERFPFSAALAADGGKPGMANLAFRCLIGFAGVIAIYVGLKAVLPGQDAPWYDFGRFFRYALLAAWGTAGAPWVFLRLKLAGARPAAPRSLPEEAGSSD